MTRLAAAAITLLLAPAPAVGGAFTYHSPGVLEGEGQGRTGDRRIYAPDMLFPLQVAKGQAAYPNTQVYRPGGAHGRGRECDPRNYSMPWSDNYCEKRSWSMPLCPAGVGHQGQDIRPPTCKDAFWDVVAAEDGTITQVTQNTTIMLRGNSGTVYRYLHTHPATIRVWPGQSVKRGEPLAKTSNFMGGTRSTTIHLHLDIKAAVRMNGAVRWAWVPVYTSLIHAFRKHLGLDPLMTARRELGVDPERELEAGGGGRPAPGTANDIVAAIPVEPSPGSAAPSSGSAALPPAPPPPPPPKKTLAEKLSFGEFRSFILQAVGDKESSLGTIAKVYPDDKPASWVVGHKLLYTNGVISFAETRIGGRDVVNLLQGELKAECANFSSNSPKKEALYNLTVADVSGVCRKKDGGSTYMGLVAISDDVNIQVYGVYGDAKQTSALRLIGDKMFQQLLASYR
jgi:murein DD-endopeptidase MepM/ murein hydrolase activator NlpD